MSEDLPSTDDEDVAELAAQYKAGEISLEEFEDALDPESDDGICGYETANGPCQNPAGPDGTCHIDSHQATANTTAAAATDGGATIQNPGQAQDAQEELIRQQGMDPLPDPQAVEDDELREHVETTEEVDFNAIEVAGEVVPIEAEFGDGLGAVAKVRLVRNASQLDDISDEKAMDTLIAIAEELNHCTSDAWPQEFWDSLDENELGSAIQQLQQQSAGGEKAGE